MTQSHSLSNCVLIVANQLNFGKIEFGEAPAAAGIGSDNSGNMPRKCAWPGAPAATSWVGHDTSRRPLELPKNNKNQSKSMKINENQ